MNHMKSQDRFKEFLGRRGLKLTPERRGILEEVLTRAGHFYIEDICRRLSSRQCSISRATVYRTIPILVECGFIKETIKRGEKSAYEYVYGHRHHDHMLCVVCGRVIEFKDDHLEEMQESICRKHGFLPVDHKLGIRGFCHRCKKGASLETVK